LRSRKELKRATNASKIIINEKEARNNTKERRKIKVKVRKTKASTKASAKANARATIIIVTTIITTTTIIIDKKRLLKSHKQFACTYVNLVFEIVSILLNYLLLFNNSREYASNTLYNQKLIKFLN